MLIHKIKFKVHGVTFNNEDNINIQDGIIKILNEYKRNNYFDELYCGYTKKEIIEMDLNVSEYEGCLFSGLIKEDMFEGQKCYKVYINTFNDSLFHIGYAPKDLINEIEEWYNKTNLKCVTNISITGGKCKCCTTKVIDYKENTTIEIKELNYGFNIELRFTDNTVNTNILTEPKSTGTFKKILKKFLK